MAYLIDGYNLLYALGAIGGGRTGPAVLEKARARLLGLLGGAHGDEAGEVTVVFDAAGAPAGAEEEANCRGIHVRFAVHHPEADDLIEALIRRDSAPRQLVVVSDDHRLQKAARRRGCTALGCQAYLETLDRRRRQRHLQASEAPEKTGELSREEMKHWLAEFADLEKEPDWKEFSDPYGFGDWLI